MKLTKLLLCGLLTLSMVFLGFPTIGLAEDTSETATQTEQTDPSQPGDDALPETSSIVSDDQATNDEALEDETPDDEALNEAMAIAMIEAYPELGLTLDQIESIVELGYGYGEITVMAAIADEADADIATILAMAESEMGWGEIIEATGLSGSHPGEWVREVIGNYPGENGQKKSKGLEKASASMLLQTKYGMTEEELAELTAQGLKEKEILFAQVAARLSGDEVQYRELLQARVENQNWDDVLDDFDIDVKQARKQYSKEVRNTTGNTEPKGHAYGRNGRDTDLDESDDESEEVEEIDEDQIDDTDDIDEEVDEEETQYQDDDQDDDQENDDEDNEDDDQVNTQASKRPQVKGNGKSRKN